METYTKRIERCRALMVDEIGGSPGTLIASDTGYLPWGCSNYPTAASEDTHASRTALPKRPLRAFRGSAYTLGRVRA